MMQAGDEVGGVRSVRSVKAGQAHGKEALQIYSVRGALYAASSVRSTGTQIEGQATVCMYDAL